MTSTNDQYFPCGNSFQAAGSLGFGRLASGVVQSRTRPVLPPGKARSSRAGAPS